MTTFYEEWLGLWDTALEEKAQARSRIDLDEVEWVETAQDAKVGLLIAPETGFRTWGSETMLAEIPVGWKTGEHEHGEEAIYIVEGTGFTVVDGVRHDWKEGSSLAIPFGSRHQHFNTGDVPAQYYSAMSVHLEHWCGLHRTVQHDTAGPIKTLPAVPRSEDGMGPNGKRISLDIENAYMRVSPETPRENVEMPPFSEDGSPLVVGDVNGMAKYLLTHKHEIREFMRINQDINDFDVTEMEISGILTDAPHTRGGKHAHMEAHLFILEGEGYSIVDGETIPWKKGTSFHVRGPQTVHQHFNESGQFSKMLRVAPGLRYFFEKAAKPTFPYLLYETAEVH